MTEYKKHELRTHILEQSPEMYVGSITPDAFDSFVVNDENQFVRKTILIVLLYTRFLMN